MIKDKQNDKEFEECFKMQTDLSYEKFFFLSATSGKAINNYHYLHSIQTYNLDKKIDSNSYEARQHSASKDD